jgi:DNA polymerase III alpha subunit
MASFRSLVRSGALDSIACGYTRPQLFWLYYHHDGEEGFFTAPAVPDFIVDYSPGMKLLDEYRSTALILSRHPLEVFRSRIERFRELSALGGRGDNGGESGSDIRSADTSAAVPFIDSRSLDRHIGRRVRIAGFMVTEKEIRTRARQEMSFVSFEDAYGIFETVVFPQVYRRLALLLEAGVAFILEGIVEIEWGALQLQVRNLTPLNRRDRSILHSGVPNFH